MLFQIEANDLEFFLVFFTFETDDINLHISSKVQKSLLIKELKTKMDKFTLELEFME